MNSREECVLFVREYERKLLENEIREMTLWPGMQWPFKKGFVAWKPTFAGRLVQVVMIPLLAPLMLLMAPVIAIGEFSTRRQQRKQRSRERDDLTAPVHVDADLKLDSLWRVHGLDKRFGLEHQLHVMGKWIELMYGAEVRRPFDLQARADAIARRQFSLNTPYYRREKDAPHFYFAPVADSLAMELAQELPAPGKGTFA
jgi:hypothetical protein